MWKKGNKRSDVLISLLENVFQISAIILLLCSYYYYRHFKKIKRVRKLTLMELSIYIITHAAMFLCAGSYLLLFLDRNHWTYESISSRRGNAFFCSVVGYSN